MSYETPNRNPYACPPSLDLSPAGIAKRHADNAYRAKWYPRYMFVLKAAILIVLALSFAGRG